MVGKPVIQTLHNEVENNREAIIQFLRDICAIPSMDGQLAEVGERIAAEMRQLGFDEVRFDKMGNILGRIGHGPTVIVYDSHIDTVGIGDPTSWEWDPFEGKVEDGNFYARGASDEKGSTPGMVYGIALGSSLGLIPKDEFTMYYFGNMEEWCDGIAPNSFVDVDPQVKPDFVVIGEPTNLDLYRGHKGRLELKITVKGKSAHAAANQLGDNATYKMLPIIEGISQMEPYLGTHEFLGSGKITVSDMKVSTASINAVPDECSIFIDRRMTFGETREDVRTQLENLIPADRKAQVTIEELFYEEPSYTGFVFPVDKYFPAWALDEDHPLVTIGQDTRRAIGLPDTPSGKWGFSTNGTYWAGKAGIPSIGFGPGSELNAHTVDEHVPLEEVVKATEFYALLPAMLRQEWSEATESYPQPIEWVTNGRARTFAESSAVNRLFSADILRQVSDFHRQLPGYHISPLKSLPGLATMIGVGGIWVKDEAHRMDLNSFKILGGFYAVYRTIRAELGLADDQELTYAQVMADDVQARLADITFVAATDGNHGRGVAQAATQLGCKSIIYVHKNTSPARIKSIRDKGAEVHVVDGDYEDAIWQLGIDAAKHDNWRIISDTSWEGYEEVPAWVMQGYTTMMAETQVQLAAQGLIKPTHIFVQGGVGALAAATIGFYRQRFGDDQPVVVVVEPSAAACLLESAKAGDGEPHAVEGDLQTIMAGLVCRRPSPLAWDVLWDFADAFVSCPDYVAAKGMRVYAVPLKGDPFLISGESGAVTLGALMFISEYPEFAPLKDQLRLGPNSQVLLINSEGNTDPEYFRRVVWEGTEPVPDKYRWSPSFLGVTHARHE
jgi:diaminopropionate ammonia-lyase